MFCSKCGKNVDDGVGFCPSCGTKVGGGVTACAQRPAGDSGKVSGAGRGKLVEYLVGAVFAVVVACGVLYRIMGTGPDLREEATGLLRKLVVKTFAENEDAKEVAKYIKLTDVRDCVLVKESKGRYSGLAQAEFTANKVGKKGETRRVVVQYGFTLLYDGENIMLQNAEPSDSEVAKLTSFVEKLVEEEEGEGGEPDDESDEKEEGDSETVSTHGEKGEDKGAAELEALLRECLPAVMAMDGVPKEDIDSKVKRKMEELMKEYQSSSVEKRANTLAEVREVAVKIRALKNDETSKKESELRGTDFVQEFQARKSTLQRKKFFVDVQGKTVSFDNLTVRKIRPCDSHDNCIELTFEPFKDDSVEPFKDFVYLWVEAHCANPEMIKITENLEEGRLLKSVKGRIDGMPRGGDYNYVYLTDVTIAVE